MIFMCFWAAWFLFFFIVFTAFVARKRPESGADDVLSVSCVLSFMFGFCSWLIYAGAREMVANAQ